MFGFWRDQNLVVYCIGSWFRMSSFFSDNLILFEKSELAKTSSGDLTPAKAWLQWAEKNIPNQSVEGFEDMDNRTQKYPKMDF